MANYWPGTNLGQIPVADKTMPYYLCN